MKGATFVTLERAAQLIWEHVWQFRRETKGHYPIPDRIWSARFAASESGETIDAVIRAEPQFKRNNAREVSRERELADTAFMLATTIGETIPMNLFDKAAVALGVLGYPSEIDVVPLLVGRALWAVKSGWSTWQQEAAVALLVVADIMDDPVGSVDETLERLKAKWGGASQADAPDTPSPSSPTAAGQSDVRIVPPGTGGARDITPAAIAQFEYMVNLQREKGIAKYGAPLTDKTEFPAWAYIWQEFADLGVYLTRLQLDSDALEEENSSLCQALEKAQAAQIEAEKRAEMWEDRWFARYWRTIPGGLPAGEGQKEMMREAQVVVYTDKRDFAKAALDLTFVPLAYYGGDGYAPEDGEEGYHGLMNARIVFRPK